jgi:hypothetical protein
MKICIVGNGASALSKHNGNFIDSCEYVVRIKNFKTKGFENFVGTKTNIFSSKWFCWFDRITNDPLKFEFLKDVKTLLFMFPDERTEETKPDRNEYVNLYQKLQLKNELPYPLSGWSDHEALLEKFDLKNKQILYFSTENVKELCCDILKIDKINYLIAKKNRQTLIEPTCGIRTIFKILKQFPTSEIFLTGFDGFKTSWYWDPDHKINISHHYLPERMYLTYLKKTKQVVFLD